MVSPDLRCRSISLTCFYACMRNAKFCKLHSVPKISAQLSNDPCQNIKWPNSLHTANNNMILHYCAKNTKR